VHRGLPDRLEDGATEGAAFKAVAQPSRRTPIATAMAAVAVLVAALLTKQLAPPAPAPIAVVSVQPAPAAAGPPTSSPKAAAAPAPTQGPPDRNPAATPYPTFVPLPVEAGTTQLLPAGATPVRLTIELPEGWQKASDSLFVKSNGEPPTGMSIGAWHLQHVNTFPCRWAAREYANPVLMRTAEGQAMALSTWWGQDPTLGPYGNARIAPLGSRPEATTIHDNPAWYVEVLIPSYLDATQCDGDQVVLWDTASGDVRMSFGPRELNHVWVVDVAGELIVIDASSFQPTPPADIAELQAIVSSIVFEP
jgi:hypothetical protein